MMAVQHFRFCLCFGRRYKLRTAEPLEEIRELFKDYSENGAMSIDRLRSFLIEIQGEVDATRQNAEEMFHNLKHLNLFQRKGLHIDSFFRYLLSDHNTILPSPAKIRHDMNAPLSHYFIYTGHNSYLTGNQLSSDSSIEPIIKALKKGVRAIELDLWPNKTKDDAIVDHGGTLTTPIKLIKCLKAIRDYAFYASEYPVIITFEDHLDSYLQAKVAKMVTQTFGTMLFIPKSDLEAFPSPEELKRKILISTKPPKEDFESQSANAAEEEASGENDLGSQIVIDAQHKDGKGGDYQDEDELDEAPEYRRLIAIHAGKLKGRAESGLTFDTGKVGRLSLSEEALEDATKENGKDLVRFTQRNLLRVYPKGTRFLSSNYDPLTGWMHGAQMVAFNMQGYGKPLWKMHGMFRANGGCGYVKKPNLLLFHGRDGDVFDTKFAETLPIRKTLKVKLYMGEGWHLDFRHTHFDVCSPPDFYARIGIAGVPGDSTATERTKTDKNQWIPIWNKEFVFPLRVPELALLRVRVKDEDTAGGSDFAGQTCLPVSELRTGIRSVPLHDWKGKKYKSVKLLVRIEFL